MTETKTPVERTPCPSCAKPVKTTKDGFVGSHQRRFALDSRRCEASGTKKRD